MRHVLSGDELVFTLVPTTGLLTPTYSGGQLLIDAGLDEVYHVVMEEEAAEYVAKGRSALAKFVAWASDDLRAGEEVVVLGPDRQMVGVGRALLTGPEMLAFSRGVAVQTRHSKRS